MADLLKFQPAARIQMRRAVRAGFSPWMRWDDRKDYEHVNSPGVYIMAHLKRVPSGPANPLPAQTRRHDLASQRAGGGSAWRSMAFIRRSISAALVLVQDQQVGISPSNLVTLSPALPYYDIVHSVAADLERQRQLGAADQWSGRLRDGRL